MKSEDKRYKSSDRAGSSLPEVAYGKLKDGTKGVSIGEEEFFLAVERKGKLWRFKLFTIFGEWRALTGWMTVSDVEHLRFYTGAMPLREFLKKEFGDKAPTVLERIIMTIQDEALRWQPIEASEATEKTAKSESDEPVREVDPAVVKQAEELLRDPLLLCRITDVLHEEIGLVGETKNALLTYLTMISSKLEDPVNQRYSSRASIGKSTIVTRVAQLFPPENLIIRGGLTKKALYYMPEADVVDENTKRLVLKRKVLIVLEESESQEFLNEIKPLLSHDVPVLKYSFVEEKVTRKVLLEGWPAYIGITTVPIRGEEHETRTLLASPDRGKEKYGAVIGDDAERHAFPWTYRRPSLEPFHELVRRLKPLNIWIPWLPIVAKHFPANRAGSMRDWKKLRTYIEAVAFLHQYQRPHITINDVEYVVASPMDLEIAVKIVELAMAETMLGLERDVKEFYEAVREEKKEIFTRKELMTVYERRFGEPIGRTTLTTRYIEKLADLGLLEIDDSKKPHKISISAESLSFLTDFEKAVLEVRSEETKAEIMRKTLSSGEGVQGVYVSEAIRDIYAYTLSSV
ncbi:MAG: hypothetical protein QMD10_09915, partial [Desulfitobacteriaceae bacterium]|nr:hypothetical protein [Desulfitobacteriaceae bacterium]